MRIRKALASLLALALGAGCTPTVGDVCTEEDEARARTPYYQMGSGTPMYPGQALIIEHCVSCHGESVAFGAPEGLNFPVGLVNGSGEQAVAQGRRLLEAQAAVHRHRDLIYSQVVGGQMPPRGFVNEADSSFADASGNLLPGIRTAEGHEALRNWLACGSPVVERTTPLAQPCSDNSACQVTNFCDVNAGQCVGVGDVVAAQGGGIDCAVPEATWSWIGNCAVTQSACGAVGCHGGAAPAGGLLIADAASTYGNLIDQGPAAMGACPTDPPYVVAGDPDGSLLLRKLELPPGEVCGSTMPIGRMEPHPNSDVIREWIQAGAMNN